MNRKFLYERMGRIILPFLFILILWHVLFIITGNEFFIPSIKTTFNKIISLLFQRKSYFFIINSSFRIIVGLFISIFIGMIMGFATYFSKFIRITIYPVVNIMRTVPVASLILILMIWMKSFYVPIALIVLLCLPIIWQSCYDALLNIDLKILEMASVFKISFLKQIIMIYTPSIVPFISIAIKNALGFSWKVGIAAEIIVLPQDSIGSALRDSKIYFDTAELFAWTIIIITLSYIFNYLYILFEIKYLKRFRGNLNENN